MYFIAVVRKICKVGSGEKDLRVVSALRRHYNVSSAHLFKKMYVAGDQVRQAKLHPVMKYDRVVLIDERGTNLGQMNSKTALGMAEGYDLKLKQVGQTIPEDPDNPLMKSVPIFRMISGKDLFDQKKEETKKARKSVEIIKETNIGTKITEHDMKNKVNQIKALLERGKSVRVFGEVRTKKKWIEPADFQIELNKRTEILKSVVERLVGYGVLVSDGKHKGNKEFILLKPTPELIAKKEERIRVMLASSKRGKKKNVSEPVDEEVLEIVGKQLEEERANEKIVRKALKLEEEEEEVEENMEYVEMAGEKDTTDKKIGTEGGMVDEKIDAEEVMVNEEVAHGSNDRIDTDK